jgi:DNA-binding MarR family transcriptional regulator
MTARKQEWVKFPSAWIINDQGLKKFRWDRGTGSNAAAALMILIALVQHADQISGTISMTYDAIEEITGLSRAKVSAGLAKLIREKLISRTEDRSTFQLLNFNPKAGWAKFPYKSMYGTGNSISAFGDFYLRKAAELHALKIFLLIAAFRNQGTNRAKIGYEKIAEYTGIDKGHIKRALSILSVQNLIHSDSEPSAFGSYGVSSLYRLVGIEPYFHSGTTGRRQMADAPIGIFE